MKRAFFVFVFPAIAFAGCSSSDDAPSVRSCKIAEPSIADWRLRADGTTFRDAFGRVVFLRGVDAGGRSKFAPYAPFDFPTNGYDGALAAYLDRAASWGVDVLRVPFTWAAVEPSQGIDDKFFLERYDALLDAAWARGMWTVVDFHQDVYAESFCGDGFPAWTIPDPRPPPHHDCPQWNLEYVQDAGVRAAFDRLWAPGSTVQAALVAMWDRMLARYKDRPGVLGFEIINEPGWGTADLATFEKTTLTAFYSAMVPRMRAAAPKSLVFVEPTGFASFTIETALTRPTGDGIVFAPHFYPFNQQVDAVQDGMAKWVAVGAAWNVPVFIGEFGANQTAPGATELMSAHFAAFDALGLSGTEWEYSVAAEPWNGELFGMVGADGKEFPMAQAIIRPYARAVSGTAVTASFDVATRTFDLAFTPSGATPTEIALPARAFPKGYAMTLDGACVDASHAGKLLVQADARSTSVKLRVTSK